MMAIAKTIPGVRNFLVDFDWGKRFQVFMWRTEWALFVYVVRLLDFSF